MKVFIRGNAVLVQTDIEEDLFNNAPDKSVFKVTDEETGNEVFRLTKGPTAALRPFGITCNTVYQGKLAASMIVESAETFTKDHAPALLALKDNEDVIQTQAARVQDKMDSLNQYITIEE